MKRLNADEMMLVALNLDDASVKNLCEASAHANKKIGCNEMYWKIKIEKEFPSFLINRQKTYREQYVFLKIFTEERWKEILLKPEIYEGFKGLRCIDLPLDLFDLLYNKISKRNWGVINYKHDNNSRVIQEFDVIREILGVLCYKNDERGRFQSFLNDPIDWIWIKEDFPKVTENNTYRSFVRSLSTFEERFSQYIIENTSNDVREEIKNYQSGKELQIYTTMLRKNIPASHIPYYKRRKIRVSKSTFLDRLPKALYDDDQIEFLQILHDGIKSKKLSVFDPLDFDLIMEKLKR